jgi:hypothetical protein
MRAVTDRPIRLGASISCGPTRCESIQPAREEAMPRRKADSSNTPTTRPTRQHATPSVAPYLARTLAPRRRTNTNSSPRSMAGRRAGEGGVFLLVPKRTPSNLKSQKNPIRYSSYPFPSRNHPKPARSNHFPFFCRGRGVGYPYPAIIWPLVMEGGSFHRDTDNHTSNEASQFRTSSVSPPNYLKERERKKNRIAIIYCPMGSHVQCWTSGATVHVDRAR